MSEYNQAPDCAPCYDNSEASGSVDLLYHTQVPHIGILKVYIQNMCEYNQPADCTPCCYVHPQASGSVDLLGLETVPSGPAPSSGGLNFLVDMFGDQPATNGVDVFSSSSGLTAGAEENYKKYVHIFSNKCTLILCHYSVVCFCYRYCV